MRANKSPWRILYKLHRYTGITVAVLVIFLSTTGIFLNHTNDLNLDQQFVESDWILDWYGIKAATNIFSFQTKQHRITQIDDQVYFDRKFLRHSSRKIAGAIETERFIVIAFPHILILLTTEGEIIEKINIQEFLPRDLNSTTGSHSIHAIGADQKGYIYLLGNDLQFVSDDGLLSWKQSELSSIRWVKPVSLPGELKTDLSNHYRSRILNKERVLLDLHSGRFFGSFGVYLMDIAGILLTFLALSGSLIWIQHKIRQLLRRNRNRKGIRSGSKL